MDKNTKTGTMYTCDEYSWGVEGYEHENQCWRANWPKSDLIGECCRKGDESKGGETTT